MPATNRHSASENVDRLNRRYDVGIMRPTCLFVALLITGCSSTPADHTAHSPEMLSRLRPVLLEATKLAIQDAVVNALPFEVFDLELKGAEALEADIGNAIVESAGGATCVRVCRRRRAPAGINDYRYVGPNGRSRCLKVFAAVESWETEEKAKVSYGWDQHMQAMSSLSVTMTRVDGQWIVTETGYVLQS